MRQLILSVVMRYWFGDRWFCFCLCNAGLAGRSLTGVLAMANELTSGSLDCIQIQKGFECFERVCFSDRLPVMGC